MKKKIFAGLLAVVMMVLLAVPAMALTSYELFSGWEQDGYPGDVTGVFYNTETKNLAILLTDNTEARQKQLRDTLTDGDTLTFFAGEYSHAKLAERAAAITGDMAENGLAGTVTIGWGKDGGFGESGMDFRVVVKTDAGNVPALTERYAKYREMVTVEEASAEAPVAPGQPEKTGMSDWGIIGIAAAAAVVLIIVITAAGNKKRAQKEQQEPGA